MTISANGSLEILENDNHIGRAASLAAASKKGDAARKVGVVQFETKVTAMKPGDKGGVLFNVASTMANESKQYTVWRSFREFMWLDYQIRTYHHKEYRIFPPLPLSGGSKKSAHNQIVSSKIIDDCSIDCEVLTQYLRVLCRHPRFCASQFLKLFLTEDNISLPSDLPNSLPNQCVFKFPQTSNVKDDFFIKECTFLSAYDPALANCSSVVKQLVFKTTDLAEIWAANSILLQASPDCSHFNKYLTLFAEVAHDFQFHSISMRDCDEISLGVTFSFFSFLLNEEKRLLELWHQSEVKCNNLRSMLNKHASGSGKHKQVSEELLREECNLESLSEQCKEEVIHYKRERSLCIGKALVSFAESQLRIAKELETSVRSSLMKLKEC